MVAVIAHALAVIRQEVYNIPTDSGQAVLLALYHDASEIFTGDMPTPVKYLNPDIMLSYKKAEALASRKLLHTLPEELRGAYAEYLSTETDASLSKIVKAADTLSAYIKCLEELKAGNGEFRSAAAQTREKLDRMDMAEVNYFIEHFIPAFELTLDELDLSVDN